MNVLESSSLEIFSAKFWERVWDEVRASSVIHDTQRADPQAWARFYDQVCSMWLEMIGEGEELGRRVAEYLLHEGLALREGSVLDVGCGPGALALALAERRVHVTAIDSSRGMIECLEDAAKRREIIHLRAHCTPWEDVQPSASCDLVTAAFFPQAMHPEGIRRMESFSRGACALVIGTGAESLPFRRLIWDRLIAKSPPHPGSHLTCAMNYLLTTGRRPGLKHLAWPFGFDVWAETVRQYFREYFALFGKTPDEIDEAVEPVLLPHLNARRIRAAGWHSVAVLWWKKPLTLDSKACLW
jgi:SAM-dependent methyltransferase